jgi:hypothetical protein
MRTFRIAAVIILTWVLADAAQATSVKVATTARQVTFTVDNTSAFTLVCDGTLTGKTKSGKYVETKMVKESVAPGTSKEVWVYVRIDSKDIFVDGWSDISCATPEE